MKNIINSLVLLLFFISINVFSADQIKEEKISEHNSLKTKVSLVNTEIDDLSNKQQKLNKTTEMDVNKTQPNLAGYIDASYSTDKPILIKISQQTNWFIYLLPLITIITVIASTFLSLKTIKIKSDESISSLKDSNKNLVNINNKSILEENERSQRTIVTNNRQEWINTLRDEITSFLAVVAVTSPDQKATELSEIEQKSLWLHNYKIQLLLNPNEVDHVELVDKIRAEINNLITCNGETLISDIISTSQKILKREWDRVKSFEKTS